MARRDGATSMRLQLVLHGAAVLLVAGIVHLAAILTWPLRARDDAFARVERFGGGQMLRTFVGPPDAARLLPFRDPAMATSFCLYDLAAGPVHLSVDVAGTDFATLSIRSRHGRVVGALTDRSASHDRIDLTLVTEAQKAVADTGAAPDGSVGDLRVATDEDRGFVMVDVLATAPSAMANAAAQAKRLVCRRASP